MSERQDTSGVIWFVAGVAIGTTVALLFAPQSGEDTRRQIGAKTRQGRESLAEQGRVLMDRGRDLYDRGRDIAGEAAGLFEEGRKIVQG